MSVKYTKNPKTGLWEKDQTAAKEAAEWEDFAKASYASAAAKDIYSVNQAMPKAVENFNAEQYALGGSGMLKNGNTLHNLKFAKYYSPIAQKSFAEGREFFDMSDDEFNQYIEASKSDAALAEELLPYVIARTGGLYNIDMTGMPKAQKQELGRMGNLSQRDTVYEKLQQNPDQEYYEHNYGEIFGDMSEKEYLDELMAYMRNEKNQNAQQDKYDAWKANADAETAKILSEPEAASMSKYVPDEEYLVPDNAYLEGADQYTDKNGVTLSAKQYREKVVNATLAALVNAGNDQKKLEALQSNIELLPELNNDQYNYEALPYMTDEQRSAFFTLYNSGQIDAAKKYLRETLDYGLRKDYVTAGNEQLKADIEDASWWEKALYSAFSVPANLLNEAQGAVLAAKGAFDPKSLEGIHEYDPMFDATLTGQTIRSEIGQDIAEGTKWAYIPGTDKNAMQMLYNAGMSAADSLANWLIFRGAPGKLASILPTVAMGAGAFNTEYQQSQDYWDSLASGIIEAGSEYIPFDIIGSNAIKPAAKVMYNMLAEGLGESSAEIINIAYDVIKNGASGEVGQMVDELITRGYTKKDAILQVIKKKGLDVLESGLTGWMSGGISAVPKATVEYTVDNKHGDTLRKNEGVDDLADLVDVLPVPEAAKDIARRWKAERAAEKGGKAEFAIDDAASVTKEDAAVERRESEMTERDKAERAEEGKAEAEQDAASVTKADAEVMKREAERTARDKAERAEEGKAETEQDAASVTKADAEAMKREAEQTARDKGKRAGKEKRTKPVSNAEIGYMYRSAMQHLDEGGRQIVRKNFARDIRRELDALGYEGNSKEASEVLMDFVSGNMTDRALELVSSSKVARDIAMSYVGKIDYRNSLYRKADSIAQRASKDYIKPESTKAEKGAQEATKGVDDRVMVTADDVELSDAPESTVDGKAVTISGVKSIDADGTIMYEVTDADGNVSEVSENDVSFGQNDADMVVVAENAKALGENGGKMVRMYRSGQDAVIYVSEFKDAVQYGKEGRDADAAIADGSFETLTPDQIKAAYRIGESGRVNMAAPTRINAKGIEVGKVDKSGIKDVQLTSEQEAAIEAASRIARAVGFNIRFVESKANAKGKYTTDNGSWDPRTLTLTLDIHAGVNSKTDYGYAMMHTLGHELTHYIRQFADARLWGEYQRFVMNHLSKKMNNKTLDDKISQLMEDQPDLTRDEAIEEIIADASAEALNNITEADIRAIAETNPSLLQKLKNFINRWVKRVKAEIRKAYKGTSTDNEITLAMTDVVDEMSARWNELFVNAARNRMRNNVASETTAPRNEMQDLEYTHIDQRTFGSVADTDTTLFCSEVEEVQIGMAAAAKILLADLENTIPGQKVWLSENEVTGQKRQTSEILGRMKDELSLTWDGLRQRLQQFALMEDSGQLPKNNLNNRRIELYLHEMLTEGYTALDGTKVNAWDEYINAIQTYEGADTQKKYSPIAGAVDFVDYAWPGEVKYSRRANDDESKSIKQQIKNHAAELNVMAPVANVASNPPQTDNLGDLRQWAIGELEKKGFEFEIPDVGHIELSKSNIKRGLGYIGVKDLPTIAAIVTLPEVITRGVVIGRHYNHKENGFQSVTIGAPVVVNGTRGNMGVVITQTDANHYKTHRILMPDGSAFTFDNKTEITPYTRVYTDVSDSAPTKKGVTSGASVPHQDEPVKKFSARRPEQTETEAFKRWFGGSKIVNADSTPKVMYHGTPYGGFRVFKDWQYFTDDPEYAETYHEPSASSIRGRYDLATNPQTYAVYLNVKKPFDTRDPKIRKIWQEEFYNHYSRTPLSDKGLPDWTDGIDLVEFIEENEYDYDAIILDEGAVGGYGDEVKSRGISVVVRDSTQIKSATDNIGTYDAENRDIYMQARNLSQLSDREILADAMLTVANGTVEAEIIENYRKRIGKLEEMQTELEKVNERIAELRKNATKTSDSPALRKAHREEMDGARNKARELKEKITNADRALISLENAKVLRDMVANVRDVTRLKTAERVRKRAEERRVRDVQKVKEIGQERIRKQRAQMEFEKYRNQMLSDAKKIQQWITAPTNKAHAPQFLRKPLMQFISAFNYSSESMLRGKEPTRSDEEFSKILTDLNDAMAKIADQQQDIENDAELFMDYIDLPANYRQYFNECVRDIKNAMDEAKNYKDTPINRMTSEQMKNLATAFRIISHSISHMNRDITQGRGISADNAADMTIDNAMEMKARIKTIKALEELISLYNWKNATPFEVFQRFGEGGKIIFGDLQDGWDKMAQHISEIIEFKKKTFTDAEAKVWDKEIADIQLSSGTVKMTTAQKMSIYCLNKRDQARGHLYGAGMRIDDIDGKFGIKITQADNYTLVYDDVEAIENSLTDRQKEVADAMQRFMSDVCGEWGNEISMKRFGFRQMSEKYYFPIQTDANNRRNINEAHEGGASMFRLLNMSFLKPLKPNARNALVVRGIFDVFSDHTSDMAKYNALALPMLDIIRWYNHVETVEIKNAKGEATGQIATRSTQKVLERVYGKDAKNYIRQFIRDLNAEHDGGRDDGFINNIIGKAKSAAVAANLRVYALQVTSLPRAAYAINPKYLAIGAAKLKNLNPVNAIKGTEAQEEIGILKWKQLGFYSTDMARNLRGMIKGNASNLEKIRDWSMAPAGWGDQWVSNVIYEAVKAEMSALDKYKHLRPGSAEYKTALNERVREIIYKTQVVDSTMTRSQLMRSKGLMSIVTAFMAEPTLTMNMLNESVWRAVELGRKGADLKEILRATGGLTVRAATTYTITAFVAALFESVFDALRDDDEFETFMEKFRQAMWKSENGAGNFIDNLNPIKMLPILNDAWSILVEGYEEDSLIMQVFSRTRGFYDAIKSYRNGKTTLYNVIYKGAQTASSLGGVAVSNAMRDFASVYNTFLAPAWGTPKWQTYADTESTAAKGYYAALLMGDKETAEYYKKRMEVNKMDMDKVRDKIASLAEKDFLKDALSESEARSMLKTEAGLDGEKIDEKINSWKFKKETGFSESKLKDNFIAGAVTKTEAINLVMKYDGLTKAEATMKVNKWQYQKDTERSYEDLRNDYVAGKITETQLRKHLKDVEGLTEEKIEERVSAYEYTKYTGKNTTPPKYWRLVQIYETGGDYDAYADQIFSDIMAEGKTWKQARSSIASSIASYYKKDYLAVKGTAEGDRMLEEILDVYEAIGYDRNYERKYIAEKWIEED